MNEWIELNYERLREITAKVCRCNDYDELFQFCILQFLTNKNIKSVPDSQKAFFFARIVKNNYHSKSSPYYNTYHKHKFQEIDNIEVIDNPYEDKDELVWVYHQIELDKKFGDWYYAKLFEIFINCGCSITKTAKKTTIPINSVSRDINKYRKLLLSRKKNKIE